MNSRPYRALFEKQAILGKAPTAQKIDEEAYTLVLQARYFWNRRAEGDEQKVLEIYQRAIEIDSSYAPAWAGLSVAYAVGALKGRMDKDEGLALAQAAAEKSLQLDPNLADAHVRMGQAYAGRGDNDKAFEWLKQIDHTPPKKIKIEPYFRVLHDDPRWRPYVESLTSPP